jgi:hypothetical protein
MTRKIPNAGLGLQPRRHARACGRGVAIKTIDPCEDRKGHKGIQTYCLRQSLFPIRVNLRSSAVRSSLIFAWDFSVSYQPLTIAMANPSYPLLPTV